MAADFLAKSPRLATPRPANLFIKVSASRRTLFPPVPEFEPGLTNPRPRS